MALLPTALALLGTAVVLTGTAAITTRAPSGVGQDAGVGPTGAVAGRADPRPSGTVPAVGSPAGSPPGPAGVTDGSSTGATGRQGLPGQGLPGQGFGWPVTGMPGVVRRFAPGPHPWSPGHRGVDLTGSGPQVLAAGAGTVAFAGSIAGRGVVTIRHDGGLRTTYEPVTPRVRVGQAVSRGEPIGALQPGSGHCSGADCLHWGALAAGRYLDPLSLLRRGRRPPVLLPLQVS